MARCVDWEWCISEVEWMVSGGWGDVIENDFSDKLDDFYPEDLALALSQQPECGASNLPEGVESYRLRLSVRRWESYDREMTIDIDEAYVLPDWTLPEETEGGVRIPKKIHREFDKIVKKIAG